MEYDVWKKNVDKHSKLYRELKHLKGKALDEAFNGSLEFGTGGIRAIMGVGPNRLNIYTIRKITYGFSKYLIDKYQDEISRGVCISHDNRANSREFAYEASKVLGSMGIRVFMFEELRPTPFLSYAVRYTKSIAGIMITASHNTKEYNGYKIYDSDGCQLLDEDAKAVKAKIEEVTDLFKIKVCDLKYLKTLGLYKVLDNTILNSFIDEDSKVILSNNEPRNINIVYTPLHGTGSTVMPLAFKANGFNAIYVKEQMVNHSDFRTVQSPNPENKSAFTRAIELAKKVNAYLVIATDPDADRVGIAVLDNKKYHFLTGNDTGALLVYYMLSNFKDKLPKNLMLFNTIVTGSLGAKIAESYGVKTFSTLTGFKYIGNQIKLLEGTKNNFFFGYEESYGYLIRDNVRDKDSIQSSLLISDMANFYLNRGKTLINVLDEIHQKYGYYLENTENIIYDSLDGKEIMNNIISKLRNKAVASIGKLNVLKVEDYLNSESLDLKTLKKAKLTLPKSNVLKYVLENNMFVVVRPSGTEPKLKIYYSVNSKSSDESNALLNSVSKSFKDLLNGD